MGRASIGASLLSGAEKKKKKHKLKQITKRCRSKILCTAFTISLYRVKSAKSDSDFAPLPYMVCENINNVRISQA